jgi:hypothetical protein
MQTVLARAVVAGMVGLAVFVQLAVWGATKIRAGGALLDSWQPYFGWPYAVAFAAAQLGVCRWLAVDRGAVWLVRTWLVGGALVLVASLVGGRSLTLDAPAALVSGLSAIVLGFGLYDGRLVPGAR